MRLLSLCLCSAIILSDFTSPVSSASSSAAFPNSITLSYEPVHEASAVKPLATILYDPKTLKCSLSSWTPPSTESKSTTPEPTSPQLLRILLPNGGSTLTSLATFNNSLTQTISLHISAADGTIYSASVSATVPPPAPRLAKSKSKSKSKSSAKTKSQTRSKGQAQSAPDELAHVQVELISPTRGPTPKLSSRKPPVIGADGKEAPAEGEVPEKSFFQKYWWAFLIITVVAMLGSGDK